MQGSKIVWAYKSQKQNFNKQVFFVTPFNAVNSDEEMDAHPPNSDDLTPAGSLFYEQIQLS